MSEVLDPALREQLSAWMDGGLAPDEARFLQRRLDHDPQLRAQWERWQLARAVLRGERVRTVSVAGAVARQLAMETAATAPASAAARRPLRSGLLPRTNFERGLAAAAAVAFAVMLWPGEQAPSAEPAAGPAIAAAPATTPTTSPLSRPPAARTPTPLLPAAVGTPTLTDIRDLPLAEGLPLQSWPRTLAPNAPVVAGAMLRLPPAADLPAPVTPLPSSPPPPPPDAVENGRGRDATTSTTPRRER
ncbi:sigma-E factor negative regulatory protein [Arenimonas composti]|uniref:Anti sigma-E protein RseA N-terminal domain-containing protein n=1 Tax=Arenimonas composti TR7-09 = DSM 18010 TaxID=1121013 RepID=A0A091B8Q7_9GAMM|nr:sigma-E factor negative regulatory protein [Arenimonas composti]KFN49008.1 hypothetical protein P873_12750 [Arenimonas composti TR7-09 = DSM 18010]